MNNARLAKWFNVLMLIVQAAISIAGFAVAGALLGITLDGWPQPYSTLVLAVLLGFLAVVVHEGGHWLGARLGGMTVLFVRAFALELQLLNQGVRYRKTRRRKGQRFDGYVIAADNANRPWRRGRLWFIAMGPLLNVLTAALCVLLALLTLNTSTSVAGCMLAFAAINLGLGLANLVPTHRQIHSDGAQLLAWWRKPNEQRPDFAYTRLLVLSVAGVAAADLPAADLDLLDQQPMPAPLVSLSYRLDALQAAGDWPRAAALGEQLEHLINANPGVREVAAAVIAITRAELAFCRAMLQRNAAGLNVLPLNRDIDWYAPTIAPCSRALEAALAGDRAGMERELQLAEQLAGNSRIKSGVAMQHALAGHVRAVLQPLMRASDEALTQA